MDDDQLIIKLQKGNQQAFRSLVANYQDMIISTCYGFLQNQEEAEDVSQEVFIQVFRSIEKFRGDSKLSTWLYRIAVNRSLNKIRSRKSKFMVVLDEVFETTHTSSTQDSPVESLENKERSEVLKGALEKLPENQKTAFVLSKYEGLANKKVAEVMEMSLSAVEALLNRAKKNLQKHLVDYYRKS